ncbi:MAG: hypothetical protein H6584_02350 [Flavobacteriales bacterium]|nr:hypothetical protein [Flavobacteriales bacterium]
MKKNYTTDDQHNRSFLRGLLPPKGWLLLVLFMMFSANSYSQSVGIVGDAVGNWNVDVVLSTSDNTIYTLNNYTFSGGGAKFRQDGSWTNNWGANAFPSGTGTQGGANIPVVAGTYNVTFNRTTGSYTFTAVSSVPTLAATTAATSITTTTATSGGNVTSDGGAAVTERGIVYATTANPTTGNTKVQSGSGTGSFTSNMTGLSPNTTYYVRAYAINSVGPAYGAQISFTTSAGPAITGAKLGVKFNGGAADWGYAGLQDGCEGAIGAWQGKNLGTMSVTGSLVLDGANVFTNTTGSTNGILYYRVYKSDATPPAYDTYNIGSTQTNCGSRFKYENPTDFTIPSSKYSVAGTYRFEVYYEITNGSTLSQGSAVSPYQATFTITEPTNDTFYSDRIYFKNGTASSEKYYAEYNAVPNGGCTGNNAETAGTEAWNGRNLGTYTTGTTAQLGAFIVTKGVQNGNGPIFRYRVYETGSTPPVFLQSNLNYVGECNADGVQVNGSDMDKIWRLPLSNISIPSTPGNYTIEVYFERNGDQMGNNGTQYISNGGSNYKAYIDVQPPTGIISSKVYLKKNSDAEIVYLADADTDCDPGGTVNFNGLSTGIVTADAYKIGGNFISTLEMTSPKLNYLLYPSGARPSSPVFSEINLSNVSTCSTRFKYEASSATQLFNSNEIVSGTYVLELYFSGVNGGTTYYKRPDPTNNYLSYFTISEPNDGNLNPTGTNISGIYESYIGHLVLRYDNNGDPDPAQRVISKVYDLDGNYASSNNISFDLGSTPPGVSFRVGMEAKVFTKGTHKACGCSSWYYLYEDGVDSDPVESDFPLPDEASQTVLYSQKWGKFTLMNSSMDWGSNDGFFSPSGESDGFNSSTPDGTYNSDLSSGATYTKFKDFRDKNTYGGTYEPASTNMAVDDPVNEVECPTCDGGYRVAVAFLCWVNTDSTKKCPGDSGYTSGTDGATLIYHRDINQNKIYNGVSLNPRHPNSPYFPGNKNSLDGTEVFYVSKIGITSSADLSTYNGSWDVNPSRVRDADLSASYDTGTGGSFVCNNLELASGVTLTIRNGDYVEVLNRAQTLGTAKIVVEAGGHFVQRCDKKASEAYIEHAHATRNLAYQDYAYWSSPIQEDIVPTLAAAGMSRMYYWDQTNRWQTMTNSSAAGIGLGRGFIAWNGDASTPGGGKALAPTFTGTATNGIVNVTVTKDDDDASNSLNFALLGNPYACALNGEEFLLANNPNIAGAYYVWTSNTRLAETDYAGSSDNTKNYNPADYATYNLTAGVGTAASASIEGGIGNSGAPTKYIASGQGFFVQALADATVVFKNFMRSTTGNTETLFRGKKSAKKSRIWININDGDGGFKQMAVGYVGGASPEYDPFFDAEMVTNSNVKIYSILEDKNLTIQGRPYWHVNSDESIPVGIYSKQETELEVSIDHFDGEFEYKEVYLEDKDLGVMHNLKDSSYRFSTTSGEYNDRFVLHFKSVVPVREEAEGNESDLIKSNLIVSTNSDGVELVNDDYKITKVEVYNILGSKIYNKLFVPANKINLTELKSQNHVVIVKVTYEDGYKETRKVLY